MGLGTLFIGYFLLLNVTYFGYTDLIAGLVMIMGLYKLSAINKEFKFAFYTASVFSVLGFAELIISVISMFMPAIEDKVLLYITPARYVIIAILCAFILRGIRDVSSEVGLKALASKANYYYLVSFIAFFIAAIFDLPIFSFIAPKALAVISILILLALFVIIAINLTVIYKAYMRICMPGDQGFKENKQSKFEFVNKFREHEAEKQREYAEYKLSKMTAKANKNKKKRKK